MAAFLFAFSSCSKEEIVSEQSLNLETSEDLTNFLDVLDAEEDYYSEYVENFASGEQEVIIRNDCVTVTFAEPKGTFPNMITLDFGDGCEGPKGRTRSGMILITQSAPMHEDGAVRTSSFVDFYIDEVQLVGTKSLTNLGLNEQGNRAINRIVDGFGLVYPDGSAASFSADHTLTQIAGAETDQKFDNVFAITGNSEGVNRKAKSFSSLITEALIKRRNCRWIVAGIKQITTENGTFTINYGDGLCNPVAIVTTPDGTEKEIHLFKKWWK
jgi:hypothetical protein